MKAAIIQPEYSKNYKDATALFAAELSFLDACDESLDIVVMPEYSDIPAMPDSNETFWESVGKFHTTLLDKASETAKRCGAFVFINGIGDKKNTTFAFNRKGELFGKYYKRHLTNGEANSRGLSRDYALSASAPYIIEDDGIRFGFLTCYDFYFYEAFSNIARYNVDIIIGCSHQRSDTHDMSELFSRFAAYNCNAYLLRSSVSMEESSETGGASMVVSPSGEVLLNMKSRIGIETVEFNPKEKHYKPAGFGNEPSPHYEYVEAGRCPWNYRPGGSAIALPDSIMPYPRICAKADSDLSSNEMLAYFGAAIALDVNEICFEIRSADEKGVLSDIFRKFSCHAIMNIHIDEDDETFLRKISPLLKQYDCEKHMYFSTSNKATIKLLSKIFPKIPICYCADALSENTIRTAYELGCKKIQFSDFAYSEKDIETAHEKGLLCNMVFCGDAKIAKEHIGSFVDTIITEDYTSVLPVFKKEKTL